MAIIGLFQCDPWCLPTQNWLKNSTNDISIHEFHNVTRHYVKDTGWTEETNASTATNSTSGRTKALYPHGGSMPTSRKKIYKSEGDKKFTPDTKQGYKNFN